MKIIARIYNDFTDKFGIPRQGSFANEIVSKIVFEKEFRDINYIKGIENFSHLWLIWNFSEIETTKCSPTVRPPRLGGNKRVGVFATRSPFRPNPIGLTSVRLKSVDITSNGPVLYVTGADILNNTPIYDIKPYIPYSDCHTNANGSFAEENKNYTLLVNVSDDMLKEFPKEKTQALKTILSCDPRPSYHKDAQRIYGMSFAGFNIKFTVDNNILTVTEIKKSAT